ncbi:MAG: TolC family protein [Alphaproteobacteria bacterium]
MRRSLLGAGLLAGVALLGGCASILEDSGVAAVQEDVSRRVGKPAPRIRSEEDAASARSRTRALLARPLDLDAAVEVALLNNRGLQAAYDELGLSAAAMTRALTPPNPGLSYSRLRRGGIVEIERGYAFDLLGLLTLPVTAAIEERRWEQAKLRTAEAVVRTASDTRRAWYEAVAAGQVLTYMRQVQDSADAAAELARRLGHTGAFGRLEQARHILFKAEAAAGLARSQIAATAARERLTRLLGLWGEEASFRLPDRLPELPEYIPDRREIEATAIAGRADIRLAKLEVEGLARSYGLTQATRFINVLEGSWMVNSETGEPRQRGWEVSLSIPLFDFGTTRAAEAENTYRAAANRLAELAVDARSETREAWEAYRIGHDLARHYLSTIVPARQAISEENLLRYNGMLVDPFELLSDARDQIAGVIAAIQAQRDFWLAGAELETVMTSGSPRALRAAADAVPSRAGAAH